jgi:hypothetical protein
MVFVRAERTPSQFAKETVVAICNSSAHRPEVVRRITSIVSLLLALGLLAVFPGVSAAQDALPWFHTYTVPGNYAVGGVDLVPTSFRNGVRTRKIAMGNQVPANAEILAAFLYWETMWRGQPSVLDQLRGQVKFRGEPVTAIKSSTQSLTPGCRAIGNGEWISMMRADVLRLLPPQLDETGRPTGRRLVNDADLTANGLDPHSVSLPDSGIFNFAPQSAGASLLVIYQDPNPATALTSIVVYDGLHVQARGADTQLTIRGFVDAVDGAAARLTFIGGSGFANLTDRVYVGNRRVDSGNPFPAGGLLTDRAWSNPTFNIPAGAWAPQDDGQYGEQVTTRVTHTLPLLLYDCLSTGAVVFSTRTQDTDGDGLPDKLEDVSGLKNPAGQAYPDIMAMGARLDQRDLFVEIGAMRSGGWDPTTSRQEPAPGPHDHMPSESVLKAVGDAFLHPPAGHDPIYVHFDVGDRGYQSPMDNPNLFVAGALARGGEPIEEQECVEDDEPGTPPCRFPGFKGVVSWPAGFQFLALAPVGPDGAELGDPKEADWCNPSSDATDCRRRFDLNRDGIFHYLLYAHARGVRKSDFPCLATDAMGHVEPVPYPTGTIACGGGLTDNPEYTKPKSSSGVAELPGRFAMVSLGLWDHAVGTENMQAQTTLHELGHNLGLWHGGAAPVFTPLPTGRVRVEVMPNCVPYYWSVMNYANQATGVVDKDGVPLVRLSGEQGPDVDEMALADGLFGQGTLPFRSSWYAPKVAGTLPFTLDSTPATKRCDGTSLQPGGPPMARLDAPFSKSSLNWSIDWNGDGSNLAPSQDVNFDGKASTGAARLRGHNDWDTLVLNRLGSGHAIFEFSLGLGLDFGGLDFGGLDFGGLDFGGLDFGGLDFGGLDFGGLDFGGLVGGLDFGGLDFGGLDFGGLDFGGLDFGGLDFGGLDFGGLDFGGLEDEANAELTYEIVIESIAPGGSTGPTALTACVLGVGNNCEPGPGDAVHGRRLQWEPPTVGTPQSYQASRVWDPSGAAEAPSPESVVTIVGTTEAPTTTLVDGEELPDGKRFIYWTRAFVAQKLGSLSNFAFVTAVNAAPEVVEDAVTLREDSPATKLNVLANDKDDDSPLSSLRAVLVTPTQHGSLVPNLDGTFTYTPGPDFFGTDSFTYQANNGVWSIDSTVPMSPNSNTATVTITVTPVNDPPIFDLPVPNPPGPALPNVTVDQTAGPQTLASFATNIRPRPDNEDDQSVIFVVTNNNNGLFTSEGQPAISPVGTLTFAPKATSSGVATVSVLLKDNGGTADQGDDTSELKTFTITVKAVALTKIQAEKTDVWFTTSASSTTKFDLKAEVLKNGTVVASGTLTNTTLGYGTTFAKALYKQIAVDCGLISFGASDTLHLRVSIKLSYVYGAPSSAAVKLYYNVPPPANSSHLHAERNFTDVKYFMIKAPTGALALQKNGTVAGPTQIIDANVTSKTTYTSLGTWSVTAP